MPITGDQSFLKNINRMALICLIRGQPGLSRADLAEKTGLTKSTVSQLVQELIDEGWLVEDGALITGSIGRRPTPLRLDVHRLALLGVDLKVEHLEILATTLTGETIVRRVQKLMTRDVQPVVAELAQGVNEVVQALRSEGRHVLGLGVGVPGPVHIASGLLHYSPNFGWRDVMLRDLIQKALAAYSLQSLPVYVQRRAGAAALGEVEFSCEQVEEPLLFIHLGSSVGAGIFMSGRLLSGHGGFAGDIGSQQLVWQGQSGSVNAKIGLKAMAGRMGLDEEGFCERVSQGDEEAVAIAREGGQFLAVLIRNLWATFDPARIVLGGLGAQLGEPLVGSAQRALLQISEGSPIQPPPVMSSRFGRQAVAVGASALVLHQLLRPF